MLVDFFLFVIAFGLIWAGAGMIVKSVHDFARANKYSEFATSFFLLGILTSVPEIGVGFNSIAEQKPEIFVGNLLGGIITLFLLVIPILAIGGNGIRLSHDFSKRNLVLSLIVLTIPAFFMLDSNINLIEAILMIIAYVALVIQMFDQGLRVKNRFPNPLGVFQQKDKHALLKIIIGITIVFIASRIVVDKTILISNAFNIPAFFISFFVISLGTNIPELSLALRAVITGKKDIAFGNYLGSASVNVLLFGVFTLFNGGSVNSIDTFIFTFVVIINAFAWFYYFLRSSNDISRREGLLLFSIYLLFAAVEIF
ncbi:MAG: cation:H+ antiporter [Patescibacteria group bacterium]|nr:cation:H+ antiporter [Patescibacteria group bacterium]